MYYFHITHTADFLFHLSQNHFSQFSSSDHFALIKSTQGKLIVLTTLNFQKTKNNLGDLFGLKILQGETSFQLLEINDLGQFEKSQQVYLSGKEGEAISAIRNTVIHDADNLESVPIYEAKSGKEPTLDQELDICNRVYVLATYNMRRVCVTIRKYNVHKPPYFQIRLFTAKENEYLKQVSYVS